MFLFGVGDSKMFVSAWISRTSSSLTHLLSLSHCLNNSFFACSIRPYFDLNDSNAFFSTEDDDESESLFSESVPKIALSFFRFRPKTDLEGP